VCGYTVTWSRQGLIGVTSSSFVANRLGSSKAAKTPPSLITLNKPCDWLVVALADARILGNYRRRFNFENLVTYSAVL
jgi:hypothetical protein